MAAKKRPSRLGRGLSSLMAQPVPVTPPAEADVGGRSTAAAAVTGDASQARSRAGAGQADDRSAVGAGQAGSPASADATAAPARATQDDPSSTGLRHLPVGAIRPNPHQPRQQFEPDALQHLADSIAREGMMQPIIVRPAEGSHGEQTARGAAGGMTSGGEASGGGGGGEGFELVAGERRWRAAQLAGLDTVPALVRELDDRQVAEWALIENLQREDLNPIERAQAFQRLIDQFQLNHEQVAQRVGVERSSVSNLLRLLGLDESVRDMLVRQLLSMGQARALAGVSDADRQVQLAERAVRQGLSVRQVEQLVRQLQAGDGGAEGASAGDESDAGSDVARRKVRSAYLADLEQQLTEQLQTRVRIRPGRKKGSGTLAVEFYSLEQFDALMERLKVEAE